MFFKQKFLETNSAKVFNDFGQKEEKDCRKRVEMAKFVVRRTGEVGQEIKQIIAGFEEQKLQSNIQKLYNNQKSFDSCQKENDVPIIRRQTGFNVTIPDEKEPDDEFGVGEEFDDGEYTFVEQYSKFLDKYDIKQPKKINITPKMAAIIENHME